MKKPLLSILAFIALSAVGQTPAPVADTNGVVDNTPDSIMQARTSRPVAGSTRIGDNPVLFLVGNSTMRTGTRGNGDNGQWGWGYFAQDLFDNNKITVENHALGGMSSRTFYNQLWDDVLAGVRPGDWVCIELGHNDNGPYDSGRARASIPGVGTDSLNVVIKETGVPETVYSYGEYMRRYIRDVKARGAHPVLVTLTPRNMWVDADSTVIVRADSTFSKWQKQVALETGVPVVDLNRITCDKYERFGKEKVKTMHYLDRIHTSEFGARENAASFAQGLKEVPELAFLASALIPDPVDNETGASRVGDNPVVFVIGDSTVKNVDKDADGMWGWGGCLQAYFDPSKITVENHAKAGRSARTFIDEGRWEKVYRALRPGDFVIIQFGHNDIGDINRGKARGELRGAGPESQVFKMEATGKNQVIYTYGWYLRKLIYDIQEKKATAIVLSPTPRNIFDNGVMDNFKTSFIPWAKQAAEEAGAWFFDINSISGGKMQNLADNKGLKAVGEYYKNDHTHTSIKGARMNAASVAQAIYGSECPLKKYISKRP